MAHECHYKKCKYNIIELLVIVSWIVRLNEKFGIFGEIKKGLARGHLLEKNPE
jgi:hypothetical protein